MNAGHGFSKKNLLKNRQFQKIVPIHFFHHNSVDGFRKFKKWHVTMVILHHIQQKYLLILQFYCDLVSKNLKIQTSVRDT